MDVRVPRPRRSKGRYWTPRVPTELCTVDSYQQEARGGVGVYL